MAVSETMDRVEAAARMRAFAGYFRNVADTIDEGGGTDGWGDQVFAELFRGNSRRALDGAMAHADAEWQHYGDWERLAEGRV